MQSKVQSFVEQCFNVGSGFIIATLIWMYFIRPLIKNGYLTVDNSLTITAIFTVVSVVRGYIWRRIFNKRIKVDKK